METLTEIPVNELADGEFYLPWDNSAVMENELAPLLAIDSGMIIIGGSVSTGKSRLLHSFAAHKLEQGLNVLLVAHEYNDIQGVDTLIFHKQDWQSKIDHNNAAKMLSRIASMAPDVVIFDDMNYPEILHMANKLAEKGNLVLTACYFSPSRDEKLAERLSMMSNIADEDFSDKQEDLIKGHLKLRNAYHRTGKINFTTRVVAEVIKP